EGNRPDPPRQCDAVGSRRGPRRSEREKENRDVDQAEIFQAMLALCRSSPRIYRCCSRRSIFSTALPRLRAPAFAPSSTNTRTPGSPRSSRRERAPRAWKSRSEERRVGKEGRWWWVVEA